MSGQAEQRRGNKVKKRKEGQDVPPEKDVATKLEYQIARWMRKNIPIKKTKFLSHTVEYFTACKAVDQLLDSPWAKPAKAGEDALFTTRESISDYLNVMLRHKLFHRAKKIVVPESELKSKKKKDKDKDSKEKKEEEKEKSGKGKADKGKAEKEKAEKEKAEKEKAEREAEESANKDETAAETSHAEGGKGEKEKKKKKPEVEKKKRKIRLDMHLEQAFVDGLDAYVWIYEPTPYYYYFFGFLVVIAVIGVCLFPLWPSSVRLGVYYLSLAAAGFLVFILALAVIRLIVFSLLWCITFGNHHLWLLPNLTEDVGFLQSFWPLYKYEYKGTQEPEEEEEEEEEEEKEDGEGNTDAQATSGDGIPLPADPLPKTEGSHSESESEGSQRSQTGKDFEIVDREEVESST